MEDIQSIVATLKHKNIGVIITDHNVDETLAITDRTYLLYEGKILKTGTAEELAADPMVRKVYLGQHFELVVDVLAEQFHALAIHIRELPAVGQFEFLEFVCHVFQFLI